MWEDFDFQVLPAQQQSGSCGSIIEMRLYAEEKVVPRNEDQLVWWRNHRQTFPSVANLQKNILGSLHLLCLLREFFPKQGKNPLLGKFGFFSAKEETD